MDVMYLVSLLQFVSDKSSKPFSLTVAVVDHRQQLLNGAGEHGLLPLQQGAVVCGAAQFALELTDQSALPLHQLVELLLFALQSLQLPPVASFQR